MTTPIRPPTRTGLNTCQDMHEKLKWEADKLKEGWSVYDTFNFVVTAHHLHIDWIDSCGSPAMKTKKASLPDDAKMVLQSIADLANGNKHWQLVRKNSLENQVVTDVRGPVIAGAYAYFTRCPMMYIDFGEYRLSMLELTHQVLGYFEWIVGDTATEFPQALLDHLESRRIL